MPASESRIPTGAGNVGNIWNSLSDAFLAMCVWCVCLWWCVCGGVCGGVCVCVCVSGFDAHFLDVKMVVCLIS